MRTFRLSPSLLAVALCSIVVGHPAAAETVVRPAPGADPIPLGVTKGVTGERMIIRGAIMVTGRGTPSSGRAVPPEGPVDIIIEQGRIVDIVPFDAVSARSGLATRPTGDVVIDASGKYVLPGLFDLHAHIPDVRQAGPQSYAYAFRLWLGHGFTTLRDAGASDFGSLVEQKRLSDAHSIVAPRIQIYKRWPNTAKTRDKGHTPDEARTLVRQYRSQGADGIKISHGPGTYLDVITAITDEARKVGMVGAMVDLKVSETDARVASRAGVVSIEHWYGIPDAALPGTQKFPLDYNYLDELQRFRNAGYLWKEADAHPERMEAVIDELIANRTSWVPTFAIYEASTDFMRVVTLPWRETLVHPTMLDQWRPREDVHASFHTDWKTSDEIAWKDNYQRWMRWLHRFWAKGGLVGMGSDSGSQQSLYGFGAVREFELMQQAGIHPLDVVKIATTNSAAIAGLDKGLCGIRQGCIADLVVVDGNPLDNFKLLYGAGFAHYGTDRTGGGVIWTIKEGEAYDAQALLREAQWYVAQEKRSSGATN